MAHTRSYTKGSHMHAYLGRPSTSRHILPRTLLMAFAIGLLSCLIMSGPNAVLSTAGAATAAPRAAVKDAHKTATLAHVYLMRGLMNVFSLGMDQLAVLIARHGIEASVHNHAEAEAVVSEIAARYSGRPRTDYLHWAFARRRCSNDYGAILGPGRNTGCACRSIRWH